MTPYRIIFMGTPDFAVPALRALHHAGHNLVSVYCQPPRPAHRGQKLQKTPIHLAAEDLGLPVHTPQTLRNQIAQQELAAQKPDLIVVAAYGLILPQAVLDIPPKGCMNIHGSLLPRWRGAAPIHRTILAGDQETGITIMQMDAGLDTGDMLLKGATKIGPQDTSQTIHDRLSDMGAELIVKAVALAQKGDLVPEAQPQEGVTYAEKLAREEGLIDWSQKATDIERKIRALTPWPSSFFKHGEETIKVLEAKIIPTLSAPPATLLDDQLTIACGKDALRLLQVQRAGKKPTDGASLLRGMRLEKGHVFS
ncbi:MAG: methionyl-tRNA formyltransferase [Bdellovibrionales bacterium]